MLLSHRRGFFFGLIAAIVAPAIVRATVIEPLWVPWGEAEFDDLLRPDPYRQDLSIFDDIITFMKENKLRLDGQPIFGTIQSPPFDEHYAGHPYRRITVKFLTSDADYVRRFHQTSSSLKGE